MFENLIYWRVDRINEILNIFRPCEMAVVAIVGMKRNVFGDLKRVVAIVCPTFYIVVVTFLCVPLQTFQRTMGWEN